MKNGSKEMNVFRNMYNKKLMQILDRVLNVAGINNRENNLINQAK